MPGLASGVAESIKHQASVDTLAFSPDGRLLLTGCRDQSARLWDVATGKLLGSPMLHRGTLNVVAFHPDGQTLVTACTNGTARLWDVKTQRPLGTLLSHDDQVIQAILNSSRQELLTASMDGSAKIWPLPKPIRDDHELVNLWLQVTTGLKLLDSGGIVGMETQSWHQARQRLEDLGGLP